MDDTLKQTISLQIFSRLSSPNFTWSILKYSVSYSLELSFKTFEPYWFLISLVFTQQSWSIFLWWQKCIFCQSIKKYQKAVYACYRNVPIAMRQTFSGCLIFHLPKEVFKAKLFHVPFILKGSLFWRKNIILSILQKSSNIMSLFSTLNRFNPLRHNALKWSDTL